MGGWKLLAAILGLLLLTNAVAATSAHAAVKAKRAPTPVSCEVGNVVLTQCHIAAVTRLGRTDTVMMYFENTTTVYRYVTPLLSCPAPGDSVLSSCSLSNGGGRALTPGARDSVRLIYTVKSSFTYPWPSALITTVGMRFEIRNGSHSYDAVIDTIAGAVRVQAFYLDAELEPGLDARTPGLCVAGCFEARYAQPLAGYRSLDIARGVTLVYSGATVAPRPFLHTRVRGRATAGALMARLTATLNGMAGTFTNGAEKLYFDTLPTPPTNGTPLPWVRLDGQLDVGSYATGLYPLKVVVRGIDGAGKFDTTNKYLIVTLPYYQLEDTVVAFLPVVNGADSPVAVGWGIAGLQRRYQYLDTLTNEVQTLIVNGDGSYDRFDLDGFPMPGATAFSRIGWDGKRVYPDSSWVVFDSAGYMTEFRDGRNGLVTAFEYESWTGGQRLKKIFDPYRKVGGVSAATVLTYGTYGLASVTAPGTGGRTTTTTVDSLGRLTAIVDPDGDSTRFSYEAHGWLTTVTDRRGGEQTFYYDTLTGLVDSVRGPSVAVDSAGTLLASRRPTIRYTPWQAAATPRASTSWTVPWPWVSDTIRTAVVRDPLQRPTWYAVDYWGQPTRVTDTLGQLTTSGRTQRLYTYREPGDTVVWARWVPTPLVSWMEDSLGRSEYEYAFDASVQPLLKRVRTPGQSDLHLAYPYGGGRACRQHLGDWHDGARPVLLQCVGPVWFTGLGGTGDDGV